MKYFKILSQQGKYVSCLAILEGRDETHAIARFRFISGEQGPLTAVLKYIKLTSMHERNK